MNILNGVRFLFKSKNQKEINLDSHKPFKFNSDVIINKCNGGEFELEKLICKKILCPDIKNYVLPKNLEINNLKCNTINNNQIITKNINSDNFKSDNIDCEYIKVKDDFIKTCKNNLVMGIKNDFVVDAKNVNIISNINIEKDLYCGNRFLKKGSVYNLKKKQNKYKIQANILLDCQIIYIEDDDDNEINEVKLPTFNKLKFEVKKDNRCFKIHICNRSLKEEIKLVPSRGCKIISGQIINKNSINEYYVFIQEKKYSLHLLNRLQYF